MGFYLGILMKSPPHRGGTQVDDFTKGLVKEKIQNSFGEEMGGVWGTPTPL